MNRKAKETTLPLSFILLEAIVAVFARRVPSLSGSCPVVCVPCNEPPVKKNRGHLRAGRPYSVSPRFASAPVQLRDSAGSEAYRLSEPLARHPKTHGEECLSDVKCLTCIGHCTHRLRSLKCT